MKQLCSNRVFSSIASHLVLQFSLFLCWQNFSDAVAADPEPPVHIDWVKQLGTSGGEVAYATETDLFGDVYVSGYTSSNLLGTHRGRTDVFLAKYSPSGDALWSTQRGTSAQEEGRDIFVDNQGNVTLTGWTLGSLAPSNGNGDAFVLQYTRSGQSLLSKQIGGSQSDSGMSVSGDQSGNIYVAGRTLGTVAAPNAGKWDAFVSKLTPGGTIDWFRQFGTDEFDYGGYLGVDTTGNIYVAGRTDAPLFGTHHGSSDVYVMKLDPNNGLLWSTQFGTASIDETLNLATDPTGGAVVVGRTYGRIGDRAYGNADAFVLKYNADGTLGWTHQIGTSAAEYGSGVDVDQFGNVYLTGFTGGRLGEESFGSRDIFLTKISPVGEELWTTQIGSAGSDWAYSVAVGNDRAIYLAGETTGQLGDVQHGLGDAFLIKLTEVPEPTTGTMIILACGILLKRSQRPIWRA